MLVEACSEHLSRLRVPEREGEREQRDAAERRVQHARTQQPVRAVIVRGAHA